jgi:hypothetical protein
MSGDDKEPKPDFSGMIYFYDFIEIIRENFPEASWLVLNEEIHWVRSAGPAMSKAKKIAEGVYQIEVRIGGGKFAVIEFERGRTGKLEPVLGGFKSG